MNNRALKVFLCHAHEDREAVHALYIRLKREGVDAWLDKAKLLPGQDWKREIEKAVYDADVVVVCQSKQFNLEGFRQKEVRWALDKAKEKPEGEIFIIPARLEECDSLESLGNWHWVDLFEDGGYEQLINALSFRAKRIGATLQSSADERSNPLPDKPIKISRNFLLVSVTVGLVVLFALQPWKFIQSLAIPTGIPTAVQSSVPSLSAYCSTPPGEFDVYVVRAGDTFFSIAVAYNVSVEELASINCLSGNNQIVLGQELIIPKTARTNTPFIKTITPIPATFTPTSTPSGFELISISEIAYRGGKAGAEIKTQPGTACELGYILPSGDLSGAAGTGPDTADENGVCSWEWTIAHGTVPGWGNIYIKAGGMDESYPIEIK